MGCGEEHEKGKGGKAGRRGAVYEHLRVDIEGLVAL